MHDVQNKIFALMHVTQSDQVIFYYSFYKRPVRSARRRKMTYAGIRTIIARTVACVRHNFPLLISRDVYKQKN